MTNFKNDQISIIEAIAARRKFGIDLQIKGEDIIGANCVDTEDQEAIISSFGFADSYRIIIGSSKAKTKIEVFQSTQDCLDEKSILRFTCEPVSKSCLISPEAFATPVTDALLRAYNADGYYKPFFKLIVSFMKLEN